MSEVHGLVLALSGGVGGARLVDGLARLLGEQLVVVANTGDDFDHLGLRICPDLDTQMYTLAGLANPVEGWGRADESWQFMGALRQLSGPDWFRLGDRDLATHVIRSQQLAQGVSLTEVTAGFCRALGIKQQLLPMSDDRVATILNCDCGELPFQEYFVARRCRPKVLSIRFSGLAGAGIQADLRALLQDPRLTAVVVCPSNPLVSIAPIVALQGLRELLRSCPAPVVGVSPIVAGQALKGPTAAMLRSTGLAVNASSVAGLYSDFLDGWVVDRADANLCQALPMASRVTGTVMVDAAARTALAREVCDFATELAAGRQPAQ